MNSQQVQFQNNGNIFDLRDYGSEGVELTPSASSNINLLQYSESSKSGPGSMPRARAQEEDRILNYHYNTMMRQMSAEPAQQTPSASINLQSYHSMPQQPGQQQYGPDLVEKMTLKIRQQGDRIKFLENYKVLCERKIKDFDQSYQFPVLPSHICKMPLQALTQPNQEVNVLRQKVADLEKQLISSKATNVKTKSLTRSASKKTSGKKVESTKAIQARQEAEDARQQVEYYQTELFRLQESNTQLEELAKKQQEDMLNQFRQDFEQFKFQKDLEVKQATDKLTETKEKKKKYKQEKTEAVDYIEDLIQKQKLVEDTHEERVKEFEKQMEECQRMEEEMKQMEIEIEGKEAEIERVREEMKVIRERGEKEEEKKGEKDMEVERLSKQLAKAEQKIGQQHTDMKEKDYQLMQADVKTKEMYATLKQREAELSRLKQEVMDVSLKKERQVADIEKEVDSIQDALKYQKDENERLRRLLGDQGGDSRKSAEEIFRLKGVEKRLQREVDELSDSFQRLSHESQAVKQEMHQVASKYDQSQIEVEQLRGKVRLLGQKETQIGELMTTLETKETVAREVEGRLNKRVKELERKLADVSGELDRRSVEVMERSQMRDTQERVQLEQQEEIKRLKKKLVDTQNMMVLKEAELKSLFEQDKLDVSFKEREMSKHLNQTERQQLETQHRVVEAERDNRDLLQRLRDTEQTLREVRGDYAKSQEGMKRAEKMVDQAEAELRRVRAKGVDDAVLISQMAEEEEAVRDALNEVVGLVANADVGDLRPAMRGHDIVPLIKQVYQVVDILSKHGNLNYQGVDSPPQKDVSQTFKTIDFRRNEKDQVNEIKGQLRVMADKVEIEQTKQADLKSLMLISVDNTSVLRMMEDVFKVLEEVGDSKGEKSHLRVVLESKESEMKGHSGFNSKEVFVLDKEVVGIRQQIKRVEAKIEQIEMRKEAIVREIQEAKKFKGEMSQEIVIEGWKNQVEELKRTNKSLREEKEWAQKRYQELETQIAYLQPTRAVERTPSQTRQSHSPLRRHVSPANQEYSSSNTRLTWQRHNDKPQTNSRISVGNTYDSAIPVRDEQSASLEYYLQPKQDDSRHLLGKHVSEVRQLPSRLGRSYESHDQMSLKDKIQQVKSIFSSIRQNCEY